MVVVCSDAAQCILLRPDTSVHVCFHVSSQLKVLLVLIVDDIFCVTDTNPVSYCAGCNSVVHVGRMAEHKVTSLLMTVSSEITEILFSYGGCYDTATAKNSIFY